MTLRLALALSLLAVAPLAGCDGAETETELVLLRVENASAVDFSSVTVAFPGAALSYGAVPSGGASAYREVETAYSYAAVGIQAAGETYTAVPYDYVGETPLAVGRYTYVLGLDGPRIVLELRADPA